MSNRSLAETLVLVSLLFTSALSVRACSGVHDRVRVCLGTVRVMFGYRSGYVRVPFGSCILGEFWACVKNQNSLYLSVPIYLKYAVVSAEISCLNFHFRRSL